jgi:hypothetical protein
VRLTEVSLHVRTTRILALDWLGGHTCIRPGTGFPLVGEGLTSGVSTTLRTWQMFIDRQLPASGWH